jgi:hypothetical protein
MPCTQDDDLASRGAINVTHQVRRSAEWNDEIACARTPNWPTAIRKLQERLHRGIEEFDGPLRNNFIFVSEKRAQSDKIGDCHP